jgi:hypothetical protein
MTVFTLCSINESSSRKFRREVIATSIRAVEIIRDLQRVQMLAIVHAIDSRSRDCGNDSFFLQRRPMLAIVRAIDSRSRDHGNDGFFYSACQCWQCYAL